ncbi:Uncharacterised protein [Neisseria meningitidis]|nr:Uncharacterised protein [Neisseria meningitidis]CWR09832.1 Uncharacterised protein [Neisseria meningitidis]
MFEMLLQYGFALFSVPLGKAFCQIDFADTAAGFDQKVGKQTRQIGKFVQQRKRQKLQNIQYKKYKFHLDTHFLFRRQNTNAV